MVLYQASGIRHLASALLTCVTDFSFPDLFSSHWLRFLSKMNALEEIELCAERHLAEDRYTNLYLIGSLFLGSSWTVSRV